VRTGGKTYDVFRVFAVKRVKGQKGGVIHVIEETDKNKFCVKNKGAVYWNNGIWEYDEHNEVLKAAQAEVKTANEALKAAQAEAEAANEALEAAQDEVEAIPERRFSRQQSAPAYLA